MAFHVEDGDNVGSQPGHVTIDNQSGGVSAEEKKKNPKAPSSWRVLFRSILTRFLLAFLASTLCFVMALVGPALVVNQLVIFTSTINPSIGFGIGLCFALLGADLMRVTFYSISWALNVRTTVRSRSAIALVLFRKLVKLKSLKEKTAGELINLLVNDLQRVVDMLNFFTFLCSAPIGVIAGTIYGCFVLGWTALMGLIGYMLLLPVQVVIVRFGFKYRTEGIVFTDKRIKTVNEVFNCIKLIKFYAWELSFSRIISHLRDKEKNFLIRIGRLQALILGIIPIAPTFVAVLTLLVHTGIGYPLTAAEAFTIIVIFNSMRQSLGVLPSAIRAVTESLVSFKRFDEFLSMEELDDYTVKIENDENAIELNDLTAASLGKVFKTDKNENGELKSCHIKGTATQNSADNNANRVEPSTLAPSDSGDEVTLVKNIDVKVKKGSLLGICGSVGSGKSSLVSAILGELRIQRGSVGICGKLAYVPQQAWIFHDTVRQNILFGSCFDVNKYERVIEACSLKQDIEIWPNGDLTEVGERGITLSGGQKQRISLARAAYSERNIVLLDDPLSAVDAYVGKHIFSECIKKEMKGRTVIFVTHQLQFLKDCDGVITLKEGRIAEHGDHVSLMKAGGEYAELLTKYDLSSGNDKKPESSFDVSASEAEPTKNEAVDEKPEKALPEERSDEVQNEKNEPLMVQESKEQGSVGWKTYKIYMKAIGGYVPSFLIFLLVFVYLCAITATNFWLTYWINEGGQISCPGESNSSTLPKSNLVNCTADSNIVTNPRTGLYQIIYGCIAIFSVVILIFQAFIFSFLTIRASSRLHHRLITKILKCPMSFFDRTPVGRLLNRFSRDIDEIDNRLPIILNSFFQTGSLVILSLATICVAFPYFLVVCLVLAIFFAILFQAFRSGVREFKRYENVYRSPYISHVTATTHGLSSIHAYNKTEEFIEMFSQYIDAHSVPFQCYHHCLQWVTLRLDTFTITVNFIVAVFVVISSVYPQSFGVTEGSAYANLALTYAVQMTGLFQICIRFMIETESLFTSVERVRDYITKCPSERPHIVEDNRPSPDWPKGGDIRFKNVAMRYRPNLPEVLHNVNFNIASKQKIGIVGRTGSGKSSLGTVLFRLTELSRGQIFIDDIDIATLGLEDLRKKLTIIPQDPVLFVGSVRYNLDPFEQHSDEEIWNALHQCHVKTLVSDLPEKLESKVVENGANFSVGERQLLCLVRAILRHSRIIMLDEATAAIDSETDGLVQDTIREAFADCTMLIIAHRLNTVLTCDKILVMDNGRVVEFDETSVLIKNPVSIFSKMLAAAEMADEGRQQAGNVNLGTKQSRSFLRNGHVSPVADDPNVARSNSNSSHDNLAFQPDNP